MGRALLEAARPPMWEIEESRGGAASEGAGRAVRFGKHRIAIADIEGISLEEVRTRNVKGLVTGAAVFLFVACMFAYFVFEQGAMQRFLLGAFFLTFLSFAGLHEAASMKKVSHFELQLTLKDGRRIVFTSADRADIQALALRIATERG